MYYEPRAPLDLIIEFAGDLFDDGMISDEFGYADPSKVIFGLLQGTLGFGLNGLYWELAGALRAADSRNTLWVNPFGVMPKAAIDLPLGMAFAHNIQACIMQIIQLIAMITKNTAAATASGGTTAGGGAGMAGGGAGCAAYGAGAPVLAASTPVAAAGVGGVASSAFMMIWDAFELIKDTIVYCAPKKFEFEAGFSLCASNFVVDDMVERFLLGPIPLMDEYALSKKGAAGARAQLGGALHVAFIRPTAERRLLVSNL
jgi:hypothetical protein